MKNVFLSQVPVPVAGAFDYLCQKPIYDLSEATEAQRKQYYIYSQSDSIDWNNIREARANIVAGGCMALGLKYAGTAHRGAHDVVIHFLREFKTYTFVARSTIASCNSIFSLTGSA